MRRRFLIVAVLVAVVAAGCSATHDPKDWTPPADQFVAWPTTGAIEVGLAPDALAEFLASPAHDFLDGLVVVRDGALVAEYYAPDSSPAMPHQLTSVSKVVLSALVGIALREGVFTSLDQRLSDIMPDYFPARLGAQKRAVTLRHLLTMTQGFAATNDPLAYLGWAHSTDHARHTLGRAQKYPPGEKFLYSNGAAHLLSVALTRASGMSTRAFAEKYLFGPLGVPIGRWKMDGAGYYIGGDDLYLTPRAVARLGALYLHDGVFAGRRILPAGWVCRSVRRRISPDTEEWGPYDYGYLWWLKTINGFPVYVGRGYGGQSLYVAPRHGIIIVTTASANILPGTARKRRLAIAAAAEKFLHAVMTPQSAQPDPCASGRQARDQAK
jgi:CubicO group peptidase (beta-lactamase class C family)